MKIAIPHTLRRKLMNIFGLSICIVFIVVFVSLTITPGIQSQRSARENNCKDKLRELVSKQNDYYFNIYAKPATLGNPPSENSVTPILKRSDYIENYITSLCLGDVRISKTGKDSNYLQSYTILAIPMGSARVKLFNLMQVNTESGLRTFAINQDSEVFVKLGGPEVLTCDNIRLHSPDEWAKVTTD